MATELWARAHCFNEVLSPVVFSIGRQEAKPRRLFQKVAFVKSIDSSVCPPPRRAFPCFAEGAKLRATSERASSNVEHSNWDVDLS